MASVMFLSPCFLTVIGGREPSISSPVPIPQELALTLAAAVKKFGGESVVTDEAGRLSSPWELQRAVRVARKKVKGLPEDFRYHDLRPHVARRGRVLTGCRCGGSGCP